MATTSAEKQRQKVALSCVLHQLRGCLRHPANSSSRRFCVEQTWEYAHDLRILWKQVKRWLDPSEALELASPRVKAVRERSRKR
jgi:hypothetical protein